MIRVVLRALLTVSFLVFVAIAVFRAIERPTGAVVEQDAGPRRYLTYVATAGNGPSFELLPGTSHFRFVSYLHLPVRTGPEVYDPLERYRYGLDFRVLEDGELVHSKTVWLVTRKSKDQHDGTSWGQESAYYAAGQSGEPSDSRMVEIDFEQFAATGRTLEVRTVGVGAQQVDVNIIGFTSFRRSRARIDWLMRTSKPELHGAFQWAVPTVAERRASLETGWRRQTTLTAVQSRALYTTGFRLELDDAIAQGEPMGPGRGVSYNLIGPAEFRFAAFSPDGGKARLELAYVDVTPEAMTARQRTVAIPAHDSMSRLLQAVDPDAEPMRIPPGVTRTIRISGGREGLRLLASISRAEAALGDHGMIRRPSGVVLIRPDFIRFPSWRLSAQPLHFRVAQDRLQAGDAVVVSARRDAAEAPTTFFYRFDDGPVQRLANDAPAALYEVASAPTLGLEDEVTLSDPQQHRIWIPRGAQTFRVWSDTDTPQWVNVSVVALDIKGGYTRRAPYDEAPPGLQWRYAPFAENPWQGIAPELMSSADRAARRWELRAQARLEPDLDAEMTLAAAEALRETPSFEAPPDPGEMGDAVTVDVLAPSVVLLDREPPGTPGWSQAHRVRVTSDRPVECTSSGELRAVVHGSRGAVYRVLWDGRVRRRRVLRTQSDQFTMRLPSGPGELAIETNSKRPLEMWASCRPRRSSDVWVARRAYQLTRGRDINVRVKARDESWTLNAVVYGPSKGRIDVAVDGGRPRRRTGSVEQLTLAERQFEWEDAPLVTRETRDTSLRLSTPIVGAIPIGNDFAPGTHRVRLKWRGARSEDVYVRFFYLARE